MHVVSCVSFLFGLCLSSPRRPPDLSPGDGAPLLPGLLRPRHPGAADLRGGPPRLPVRRRRAAQHRDGERAEAGGAFHPAAAGWRGGLLDRPAQEPPAKQARRRQPASLPVAVLLAGRQQSQVQVDGGGCLRCGVVLSLF